MTQETVKLYTTGGYPSQWDDLFTSQRRIYARISTLWDALDDGIKNAGISQSKDGIFQIVVDAPTLRKGVVIKSLEELSRITGIRYQLVEDPTLREDIAQLARRALEEGPRIPYEDIREQLIKS